MPPARPPILNLDDVALKPWGHGHDFPGASGAPAGYAAQLGAIGSRLGAQKLGYGLEVLAPGKSAFPAHNHRVNEELFLILSGEGELRVGADRWPVRAGDVICCPPGGPETAHQLTNTGAGELRVFAVSTRQSPEIVEYPDSGKIGFAGEFPAAEPGQPPQVLRSLQRAGQSLNYWDGE